MESSPGYGFPNENDLNSLIEQAKNKFQALHADNIDWPCPFCIVSCKTKNQCRFHVKKEHPAFFYGIEKDLTMFSHSDSSPSVYNSPCTLPFPDFNDSQSDSVNANAQQFAQPKSISETDDYQILMKYPHCPQRSNQKLFKGRKGLKHHHTRMHKLVEFIDPILVESLISVEEKIDVSVDFSLDGAQSLNLQNYLISKGVVNSNDQNTSEKFSCIPCKRSFASYRGLQVHRGHHEKLSNKINAKVIDRKHKGFDQEFFSADQLDQYDTVPNDLEEFLLMNNMDLCTDSNKTSNFPEKSNSQSLNQDNTTCPVCCFVAKSKGGLKLHMKVHLRSDKKGQILFNEANVGKLNELIIFYRRNSRLLHQIPKGARAAAADKLSKLIDICVLKNDFVSWRNLFVFSYTSLCMPEKDNKTSLTSAVKKNIFKEHDISSLNLSIHHPRTQSKDTLSRRIEEKVADGDIKNAMRLLTSEDSLAPENQETFESLLSKHPKPSRVIHLPDPPNNVSSIIVEEKTVLKAINSYKKGSAAGLDGIKPQFLKDMLTKRCGEAATRLLKSLTSLVNFMLAGKLCSQICEYMFGAIFIALKKKDGGIRPIAIGNTFRRLCAKLACSEVCTKMAHYLSPKQVGFAVRGGCEAAVHTARKFISTISSPRKVMLNKDMKNAFNSVERDTILKSIKDKVPELFPLMYQAYAKPSILLYGSKIIESAVGCQQGDPLGPLGFSLAIHPLVMMLKSEFNVFYLDDGTIGDDFEVVLNDFKLFISECKKLGLSINQSKCELFIPFDEFKDVIIDAFREVAPDIKIVGEGDLSLLGSPLTDLAANSILSSKIDTYQLLSDRLKSVHHHVALFLLRNCMAIPMMMYLLRSAPIFGNALLKDLDDILKSSLECFLNTELDGDSWSQASLPVTSGGVGVRKLRDVAIPAYSASVYSVQELASAIFPISIVNENQHLEIAETSWKAFTDLNETPSIPSEQKNWDTPVTSKIFSDLPRDNLVHKARLIAVSEKESGDWLNAVPSSNLGTLLDPETLRIAVSLRLGTKIYRSHPCRCGELSDEYGHHGLKCLKSAGRFSRHSALNDLIKRALLTAEVPSILEPVDISRDDNSSRVDGVTIIPWSHGRQLAWDATCVDPMCASNVKRSSVKACSAADKAVLKKRNDYRTVINQYWFVAFAVECLGGWSNEAKVFAKDLGRRLINATGEPRSLLFFRQRISLAIQRGNAASVLGTIPPQINLNEVYYLR